MFRVALIGCGEHAKLQHAPALQQLAKQRGDMALVAACDMDLSRAESMCQAFDLEQAYGDLSEMLVQAKPNVCVLVTSMPAASARTILEHRLPCMIEKPPGANLEEARSLVSLAEQVGVPHMVSMNRRFNPHIHRMAQWVKQQGEVRYLRATLARHARFEPNHLWSTGLHTVDAMRHLGGDVEHYQATRWNDDQRPTWYAIHLQFCSGAQGTIELIPSCGMQEETYEMFGNGFRAKAGIRGYSDNYLECWRDGGKVEIEIPPCSSVIERVGVWAETQSFFEALAAGVHPKPSLADVLPSMEICHNVALDDHVAEIAGKVIQDA